MKRFLVLGAALGLLLAACSTDDGSAGSTTTTGGDGASTTSAPSNSEGTSDEGNVVLFNGQGNDLDVYGTEPPFDTQKLVTNAEDDPTDGLDINAQICFFDPGDDHEGETWFISGEDTGQPDPPAGWGIFRLEGDRVGSLSTTQVGKLTPTYQEGADAENYGCGVLSDGRIVTTDIGSQALGDGTGQLILWYPPFDSREVSYCKIDVGIPTAQSIWVNEDDEVFVASSRPDPEDPAGVYRFSPPFPTSGDAEGGCGSTDTTGAPMADEVSKELWIEASGDTGLGTPAGLAPAPDGGLYVSAVAIAGVINEYDADGEYVRTILAPPEGETIGAEPFSTGTPLGIGVGPDGTLYYADIGLVREEGGTPGPGPNTGSLRRIVFVDGEPQPPEVLADGLAFPDGIGVWQVGNVGGSGSSPP
jgi:hypothetical protein